MVRNLPEFSSRIVQFSFKEILEKIQRAKDQVGLKILLLYEVVGRPLMLRQIADILEVEEVTIEAKIPLLANYECVKRIIQDNQEKYYLNDEIRLLTKSLIQQHHDLYRDIRKKYFQNFSLDRQMDFTAEEEMLIDTFENYLKDGLDVEAEDFIRRELGRRNDSLLLNLYYAKYLKKIHRHDEAINILERIREISKNHPTILKQLFSCYASLEIPKFEKAEQLLTQIQADLKDEMDTDLKIEVARFLVRWSTMLKTKRGIDPFEENRRIFNYKELAQRALRILNDIEREISNPQQAKQEVPVNTAEVYYLLAQCHHNLWDNDEAIRMINKAIFIANRNLTDYSLLNYEKFQEKYHK